MSYPVVAEHTAPVGARRARPAPPANNSMASRRTALLGLFAVLVAVGCSPFVPAGIDIAVEQTALPTTSAVAGLDIVAVVEGVGIVVAQATPPVAHTPRNSSRGSRFHAVDSRSRDRSSGFTSFVVRSTSL